jgi:trimeric autotransporter adhesin
MAYKVQSFQIAGGPDWINSERFDIEAKPDTPSTTEMRHMNDKQREAFMDQQRLRLQSLLADRWHIYWCFRASMVACLSALSLSAFEYHGQVRFGGLPVPGATVIATQDGTRKFIAITDQQGLYSFRDLISGTWTIEVEVAGFSPLRRDVTVNPNSPPTEWDLTMLPLSEMEAMLKPVTPTALAPPFSALQPAEPRPKMSGETTPTPEAPAQDLAERAMDGLLINGSQNNGAASPFAQSPVFGNNRRGSRGLYNGGLGFTFDNSALDARPFSLTGQDTPKPTYNRMTGLATFGGPLRISHLLRNGPNIFLAYQWTRNRDATTRSALMPTAAERNGDFSNTLMQFGRSLTILDPTNGLPFPGNMIPQNRFSPQAQSLLRFYPLPNFAGSSSYNYQIPILTPTHQDAFQSRLNKTIDNRNQLYGGFALQSTRTDTPNLFGFLDTTDLLGLNARINWSHRFSQRVFANLGCQFSRSSTHTTSFFENRENVSAEAGIIGNNQDPFNWGPPTLSFSSGIASLTDAQSAFNRNQTNGITGSLIWNRSGHNFMLGADFRREESNYLEQQNPRGTFTFTGAAAGSDFADFLLGIPDTSSIAFGNADKYFRESVYDAYFTDDWRVSPEFTLNAGMRWEYGAPITELYRRLVNLDIAPQFSAVAPVVAGNPTGPLTGQHYPDSLIRPDRSGFEPRIGLAWRPIAGSSLVVRAGYGVYYDTSVYQNIAVEMAQQSPLSKSLSVQNSTANPLSLANGFKAAPLTTPNTFAIDPDFRVGYAQEWQLTLQRDLPGSLQMLAEYLGIKGTRGVQEFLPNTYPIGAVNPCRACPVGFVYVSSNGNSAREAAQIQLRRRLHNGFTATLVYTFSKAIDDVAALGGQGVYGIPQPSTTRNPFSPISAAPSRGSSSTGMSASAGSAGPTSGYAGPVIAQDWLNLSAERSLSDFDQRHDVALQLQYTTGIGLHGGTLLSGWRGALLKEWTFAAQVTAASGFPLTPIYPVAVPGTGVTGPIRPEYTGAPLYAVSAGLFLNPAAYVAPLAGQWGNAGRNSITGPAQFAVNVSLGRTFRLSDRFNLDLRVDSTNALNHVTYTSWNTTVTDAQFGLPTSANAMRNLQTTLRVRF